LVHLCLVVSAGQKNLPFRAYVLSPLTASSEVQEFFTKLQPAHLPHSR